MSPVLRAALAGVCLPAVLGGCFGLAVVSLVESGISISMAMDQVRSKKAAVLLHRTTVTDEKGAVVPRSWAAIKIEKVVAAEGEKSARVYQGWHPNFPEFGQAGWYYLVLAPGVYRVYIPLETRYNPKSGFFDAEMAWRTAEGPSQPPVFRFEVLPGQRLLYAGSPHVECPGEWKGVAGAACSSAEVKDETKRAREIAQAEFAEFGPLVTHLMRRE